MATTEPWLIVTPAQLKSGWIDYGDRGAGHREFEVLGTFENGDFIVRNPALAKAEEEMAWKR
jgi:hypothetical protein